jgi:hypothetical protein
MSRQTSLSLPRKLASTCLAAEILSSTVFAFSNTSCREIEQSSPRRAVVLAQSSHDEPRCIWRLVRCQRRVPVEAQRLTPTSVARVLVAS